jgi:hypothetical protein
MFEILQNLGIFDEDHQLFIGYSWYGYQKKTLQELNNDTRKAKVEWEASEQCIKLEVQLRTMKGDGLAPVTNIVTLGIGSLH